MSEQLTHWKKLVNPEYLGSYALDPGQDMTLTIKSCGLEMITGSSGKKEEKMVMHFMENVKPMIVNRTNSKTITKLYKTPYIEQWAGKKIILYARQITAFGEEVDALRIRDYEPKPPAPIDITQGLLKLNEATTLKELQMAYLSLSKSEQSDARLIKLKDELKTKLK